MNLPDNLFSPPFAHRGLWSEDGFAENSLSAIERACQAHYGVEFDVRLSADEEAMVFHDETLHRMAGLDAPVRSLKAAELMKTPLRGGPDGIPSLSQVLELVRGRAMLLIELKPGPDVEALAWRASQVLKAYRGPFAVISFDVEALGWYSRHAPDTPRGLDARWKSADEAEIKDELERQFSLAKPHFLVLELEAAMGPLATARRALGQPVIAWTVRSTDDAERVAEHCDNFIFEGFTA